MSLKDVTASSGYEIGDYVDKVLISKENSDKIIMRKLPDNMASVKRETFSGAYLNSHSGGNSGNV